MRIRMHWDTLLLMTLIVAAGVGVVWYAAHRTREVHERLRYNQELLCLGLAYHRFAAVNSTSPRQLADIEAERSSFPQVYTQIQEGSFILLWNAQLTGDGDQNDQYILGYESRTPRVGGWVLLGGGGRKQVSVSEYHALPLLPTQ